jgi:hypothetical protein
MLVSMANSVSDIETAMRVNTVGVRFADAAKVAEHYFGAPRQKGSHCIYQTP